MWHPFSAPLYNPALVRFFVTGTDTNVGKTEVAAALLGLLAAQGHEPFAFKPYESGVSNLAAPADALRLQAAARTDQPLDTVSLFRFKRALAPGIAAQREGRPTEWRTTVRVYRSFTSDWGVVEGAGGLFVPLDSRHDVIDLISALGAPVVLVARAGLGTINHSSLSVEALRRRRITIAALVLNATSPGPDPSAEGNRDELRRRFPRLNILGPGRFVKERARRDAMLRAMLQPLAEVALDVF